MSTAHTYPAQQRIYTITSDPKRATTLGVDEVVVPSGDGVNVGVEGTFYFTLNLDHPTLEAFDDRYGTRTYIGEGGDDMLYAWDGDEGWSAFFSQAVRPVIYNTLRVQIGAMRCEELVPTCAFLNGADIPEPSTGLANLARVQTGVNASLEREIQAMLGGPYLTRLPLQPGPDHPARRGPAEHHQGPGRAGRHPPGRGQSRTGQDRRPRAGDRRRGRGRRQPRPAEGLRGLPRLRGDRQDQRTARRHHRLRARQPRGRGRLRQVDDCLPTVSEPGSSNAHGETRPFRVRSSTAEWAAAILRQRVTQGGLPPGSRLAEDELTAELEVLPQHLREAFSLLGHERLLEHRFNRACTCRVLSPDGRRRHLPGPPHDRGHRRPPSGQGPHLLDRPAGRGLRRGEGGDGGPLARRRHRRPALPPAHRLRSTGAGGWTR